LRHDTGISPESQTIKTPTLWEISKTAPYFHDGSAQTLADVIDSYDRGGPIHPRSHAGIRIIDPELRPLGLSPIEKDALEQYLRALVPMDVLTLQADTDSIGVARTRADGDAV
jgi:hypothetical protein